MAAFEDAGVSVGGMMHDTPPQPGELQDRLRDAINEHERYPLDAWMCELFRDASAAIAELGAENAGLKQTKSDADEIHARGRKQYAHLCRGLKSILGLADWPEMPGMFVDGVLELVAKAVQCPASPAPAEAAELAALILPRAGDFAVVMTDDLQCRETLHFNVIVERFTEALEILSCPFDDRRVDELVRKLMSFVRRYMPVEPETDRLVELLMRCFTGAIREFSDLALSRPE